MADKHRIEIPGPSGHELHTYSPADTVGVLAAQELFNQTRALGKAAFDDSPGKKTEIMFEFDPNVEVITFFDPVVGG